MSYTPQQLAAAGTEHAHQAAVFCWIRRKAQYYPQLEWAFAVPNGGHRDRITAGKLKAEGVTPGVFDFVVPYPVEPFHGLFIEMKKPGGIVSAEQKKFGKEMVSRGYQCFVCYGWDSAVETIANYLGISADYPSKPKVVEDEKDFIAVTAERRRGRSSRRVQPD
ncbi:VRR-NUC domain protein [compost metagenome]